MRPLKVRVAPAPQPDGRSNSPLSRPGDPGYPWPAAHSAGDQYTAPVSITVDAGRGPLHGVEGKPKQALLPQRTSSLKPLLRGDSVAREDANTSPYDRVRITE